MTTKREQALIEALRTIATAVPETIDGPGGRMSVIHSGHRDVAARALAAHQAQPERYCGDCAIKPTCEISALIVNVAERPANNEWPWHCVDWEAPAPTKED